MLVLKDNWNSFEITEISYDLTYEYYETITFNFKIIESFGIVQKKEYKNINIKIENNLPYSMILRKILNKCLEIIEE